MTKNFKKTVDPMIPNPNWDERYEPIIAQRFWFGEFLCASPLGNNLHRIEKQPMHGPINYGDTVRAVKRDYGLVLVDVVQKSDYKAKVLKWLPRNKQGRKLFDALNRLGVCEPIASGDFVMTAPEAKWPEIMTLLENTGVRVSPFWWEDYEKEFIYDDSGL